MASNSSGVIKTPAASGPSIISCDTALIYDYRKTFLAISSAIIGWCG